MAKKLSPEDKKINKEKKSLKQAFEDIPDEKQAIADKLIDRLSFMTVTLENLEEDIKTNGPVVEMVNGKQILLIENPAQKSYNTMINRFTSTYDKLIGLLPKEVSVPVTDDDNGFSKFLGQRQ
ncbi:hypothetical protein [Companilactobacillus metriopterae]|uniref:hypothetical protein n=1 Tax=Companilactobacillus metriopterae TaxID=1909267 RepID=UPI00100B833F|nr:hypothetical protein [Companilactobacillus metriopterae]